MLLLVNYDTIKLLDTQSGKIVNEIICSDNARSATFSPDSKYIAARVNAGSVQIWDVESGILLQSINMSGFILNTEFFSHGQVFVRSSSVCELYDIKLGTLLQSINISGSILNTEFFPHGQIFVHRSNGGFGLYDIKSGHEIQIEHNDLTQLYDIELKREMEDFELGPRLTADISPNGNM
ncbi:WD-40 repeat protein, partial [Reticulomyxa filosa]